MLSVASGMSEKRRWLQPLLWLLVAALALFPLWTFSSPALPRPEVGDHATYYVVAHHHYALSLSAWAVLFGVVYAIMAAVRAPYRPWLGYAHFGLTLIGFGLVFSPMALLSASGPSRYGQRPEQTFAALNAISSAGYLAALAGLAFFVAVLVGAVMGWARRGNVQTAQ